MAAPDHSSEDPQEILAHQSEYVRKRLAAMEECATVSTSRPIPTPSGP